MKKLVILFCLLLLPLASCTEREADPSTPDPSPGTNPSADASIPETGEADPVSPELQDLCFGAMQDLFYASALYGSWQGAPVIPDESPAAIDLEIIEIRPEGDAVTVTAELYGNIYIDPATLEETVGYGPVWIMPAQDPHAPQLAFGKSTVEFRLSGGGLAPRSCAYEQYPHPGLDYLRSQTERLEPALSASERLDASQYDPQLVEYVWQVLFAHRYIETPADITLYDLENLRDGLDIPHPFIYGPEAEDPDVRLDASLLRLMPNLEYVTAPHLTDYSVFEGMQNLRSLTFYGADDELFRTLRVGHTEELILHDPDVGLLDLTNVNTEALRLISWTTAVGGFAGCERIEKLYIMSTRTDMRLVNAGAFPGVTYLNLYFYSDTPRVRDFSQLATFENARIDLYLDYQACNNETLESLKNVPLGDLVVNPANGSYPLPDLDYTLIQSLDTRSTNFGMEMYFQERTGTEPYTEIPTPLFSAGPGGEKIPLSTGGTLHGWTLDHIENPAELAEQRITARFSGAATLKGSIRIHSAQDADAIMAGVVTFTVAEESLPLLPYYEHDTRTVWFEITNGDAVREAAGAESGEFPDCEITINGYYYICAPMMTWNSSLVTEIHKIG